MNADKRRYNACNEALLCDSPSNCTAEVAPMPVGFIGVHRRLRCKSMKPLHGLQALVGGRHAFRKPRLPSAVPNFFSKGFTLIEVMIVVVILGILAAVVVPKILDRPDQAKVTAAKADIAIIMQALKLYRLDNGMYPSTEQGLQALTVKPTTKPEPPNWKQGGYIERLPTDPWKTPYQYLFPGIKGEIDVYSLGADKQAGGENNNADIGSWAL
jgi:general secretion pathway protein G